MATPTGAAILAVNENRNTNRVRWGQIVVWLALAALLAVVGVKLYQVTLGPVSSGGAPDFTLNTFDGEEITLSDLAGQVVVINFWASWCGPCEIEAADLEETWLAYRERGVIFLGVGYVDTEREALEFIVRHNVTYPNGPDLGTRISQAYRIRGVPETFIVGPNGQLAETIIGPTNRTQLTTILEQLLVE